MIVHGHIKRLHAYNEAKDAAQVSLRFWSVHLTKLINTGSHGKGSSIASFFWVGAQAYRRYLQLAVLQGTTVRQMHMNYDLGPED